MKKLSYRRIKRKTRLQPQETKRQNEIGDTLIEVLVALVVIGIASVALLLTFTTSISGSAEYRTLASFDTAVRSSMEEATSIFQQLGSGTWSNCASLVAYESTPLNVLPAIPGYTEQITSVASCVKNSSVLVTVAATSTSSGKIQTISSTIGDPQLPPTPTLGSASHLVFSQPLVNGTAGIALSTQPVVVVEDSNGNIVTNDWSLVTLAITPGTGTSGATLSSSCLGSGAGVITFSGCSIDKAGSNYTLTASDGSLTSGVSNALNITSSTAAMLAFSTSPSTSAVGTAFSTQPVVTVEDSSGNTVTTDSSTVSLSITSGSGTAGATLAPCSGTESLGIITFSGCSIGTIGTNYTLAASDGNLTTATSNTFNITAGAASKLVFTTSPTNSAVGSAFPTQPIVAVEDSNGNTVTTDSSSVSLAITTGTGTSGASLSNCAGTEASGVVTFSGCLINKTGTNYTLTASDGNLTSATSNTFNVSVGTAAKLIFTTSPSNGTLGSAFPTQPIVAVEDSNGNTVTTDSSTATLTIHSGTNGASISGCSAPESGGVFRFSGCSINKTGTYTLTVSDGTLTSATSSDFAISWGR